MNQTILEVHFDYTMPTAEFEGLCEHAAAAIANVAGLQWKIFLLDVQQRTAGGHYLFQDRAAAEAYLEGPIVAGLRQRPDITNLKARLFDIQQTPTKATRGPLEPREHRSAMATAGA